MVYNLDVDGLQSRVTLDEEKVTIESFGNTHKSYPIDDVIGCEEVVTGWFWRTEVTRVWLIEHGPSNSLLKRSIIVSGDLRKRFQHDLTEKTTTETKRPKRVLVMINPIGGNGTARKDFGDIVEPVFRLSGISMDTIFSERSGHMIEVAQTYDFTGIDGIVLLGGDGTYHEVVDVLMKRKQEEQGVDINDPQATLSPLNIPIAMIPTGKPAFNIPIIMLPTGTGNVVAENNTGSIDILTAALHVVQGRVVPSHLMALYSNRKLLGFSGAGTFYGFITDCVFYSDRNFRWLGRSRYRYVFWWMTIFKSHSQRAFNAKITYYTSVTEQRNVENNETEIFVGDRKISGYSSYTTDTVVFDRKFCSMMLMNGNSFHDGDVIVDIPRMLVNRAAVCSSFMIYGDTSLRSVMRFLRQFNRRKPVEIVKDELEAVTAQGFTVEMTDDLRDEDPEVKMLRRIILLDGEMYELKRSSFQLWYKRDVVQVFSSYL
ncbi:uncharacterized protein LOC125672299 isoform X2 [Ostrea edulis]|uniref:uncharacterized protein LOC125672299 isoform X2 n=1 Tax=Ostrea edulis TaxID=37623 RepID=UPI0024AF6FA4|nr:uncharacterized protein LOC125672299 isoform X2 [Ostrea edulis]